MSNRWPKPILVHRPSLLRRALPYLFLLLMLGFFILAAFAHTIMHYLEMIP